MNILIIEDELHLQEALAASLKKEGYQTDCASDGISGLELALSDRYDVILLDLMLPGLGGYQVLKQLRREKTESAVIILSAKSELEDKIAGLDFGADDYLTKPFQMKELFARIRAVTRRHGEVVRDELVFQDLYLNIRTFTLSSSATSHTLTLGSKEFQLMEYLMRNPKQVISRSRITEKIWGYDSEVEYNNVDVYISFLRKKLKHTGAHVEIRAVRGIGYTLQEAGADL
ncbi:response regulator transcription factor [Marvinbryantia formatexigens]|nr:response regulator transcription factor [Marvinbryantia formatexigens]UWO26619.1 response regulator transcription factor [Marvinbryantia formatexigens DSM 14469]SDG46905.1 DNA-binding response regulator, OmpR family, contains REC and winged-helix (wHTH) domain [Marvinbryantia formatexigens]